MTCYFKNFACIDFGISHIATVYVIYLPLDPELVKHLFRMLNYHLLVTWYIHVVTYVCFILHRQEVSVQPVFILGQQY